MDAGMDERRVKVRLRFKESDRLPAGEGMWASPIEAHDGGGIYALDNSSFFVPLAMGDLVRAEVDGDGDLQVVDVVSASASLLTVVAAHCAGAQVQAMVDRWAAQGALWTEGTGGVLVTTWRADLAVDQVEEVLLPDLALGRGEWLSTAGPADRVREAMRDLELELDRHQHFAPVDTDYWAADDPYWESVGMAEPEFLASLQMLAGEDELVARALERGEHERVLVYLGRMPASDGRYLPPLDGPPFDED